MCRCVVSLSASIAHFSDDRFPGQGAGDAKIPSVICYTQDGKVEAVGAEAADETMLVRVKEEGLVFVERSEF